MLLRNSGTTIGTWRLPEGRRTIWPWVLFLAVLLVGLAGCNVRPKTAGLPAGFWESVRPAAGETERLLRNARFFKQAGRLSLALKELEEAHRRDPDNILVVDALTRCYEELGEWQRAEELYVDALARHKDNPALANNQCFSYYLAGKLDQAEAGFRQTLKRYPGDATIRNNLGLVLTRRGRPEEALALWRATEGDAGSRRRLEQAQLALGAKPALAGLPDQGHKVTTTAARALGTAALAPPPDSPTADAEASDAARQSQDRSLADAPPAGTLADQRTTIEPASEPARGPGGPIQVHVSADSQSVGEALPNQSKAPAGLTPLIPAPADRIRTTTALPAPRLPVLRVEELLYTKVELLNGNGIRHFARQNRYRLYLEGFDTVAIGNYRDFAQAETAIIYRPRAARVAQVLGHKYFRTTNLTMNPQLKEGVEVCVILGRDVLQKEDVLAKLAD